MTQRSLDKITEIRQELQYLNSRKYAAKILGILLRIVTAHEEEADKDLVFQKGKEEEQLLAYIFNNKNFISDYIKERYSVSQLVDACAVFLKNFDAHLEFDDSLSSRKNSALNLIDALGHEMFLLRRSLSENLKLAILKDEAEIIEMIVKEGDGNILGMAENTLECDDVLKFTIENNLLDAMMVLLEHHRLKNNKSDSNNNSLLFVALKNENKEAFKLLLKFGEFDLNALGEEGDTPLQRAVFLGWSDVVESMLLYPGIDVNQKDKYQYSAFFYAANYARVEILKAFIKWSAKIEVKEIIDYINSTRASEDISPYLLHFIQSGLNREQLLQITIDIIELEEAVNDQSILSLLNISETENKKLEFAYAVLNLNKLAKKIDLGVHNQIAGDNESSMNDSLTLVANQHFNATIKPNYKEKFDRYGSTDDERLIAIEREIRLELLKKIETECDREIEISSKGGDSKRAKEIKDFIKNHTLALIDANEQVLKIAREKYFTSNVDIAQVSWRAYDPQAPVGGPWPNLLTVQSSHIGQDAAFVTAASSVTSLNISQASDIVRERAAYYFLISKEITGGFDYFMSNIMEIRRAHNTQANQPDDPSCFPGHLTRIAMSAQGHPLAELPRSSRQVMEEEAKIYITKFFHDYIRSHSFSENNELYMALASLCDYNAEDIFSKSNCRSGYHDSWVSLRNEFIKNLYYMCDDLKNKIMERLGRQLDENEFMYIDLLLQNPAGNFSFSFISSVYKQYAPQVEVLGGEEKFENINPFPVADYVKVLNLLPASLGNREIIAMKKVENAWNLHHAYSIIYTNLRKAFQNDSNETLSEYAKQLSEGYVDNGKNFKKALENLPFIQVPESMIENFESELGKMPSPETIVHSSTKRTAPLTNRVFSPINDEKFEDKKYFNSSSTRFTKP